MNVVVVESPAKAKTINKYLGGDYQVLASYGHVRDLPSKDGSVRPDEDFAMSWAVDTRSQKRVKEIADAVKGSDRLILATDPDREGEAISWHLLEVLKNKKALKDVAVDRVVFNAITKTAVLDAMKNPRQIDMELVEAYLARRALDYLVGFTLSPVLWRKLPGARSAGRVQSVALRLICEREFEIEKFVAEEYWTLKAQASAGGSEPFEARLTHLDGGKLDKFGLPDEASATDAKQKIEAASFRIGAVEAKPTKRNPPPPFTTSTLQQDASNRLGYAAKRTMQIAQKLYEDGLITYMRTDGIDMAGEAIAQSRDAVKSKFGDKYLPKSPRKYTSKAKNAQEAHEAIRPTDFNRSPEDVRLDADAAKLYRLIWNRATASQMEAATIERTSIDLVSGDEKITLRANGSVILFDGFLKLYASADKDEDTRLPKVTEGDDAETKEVEAEQHFTQPPPRFTEASLVKTLEELGIGRPSTYASIISVLQDRDYVRLEKRRFVPDDKGRIVTAFLENFFRRYVEYDFTADLEEKLDKVSAGDLDWKALLDAFWKEFSASVDDIGDLRIGQVLDALDEALGPHFFQQTEDGKDPRLCPKCGEGRLSLKLSRYGAFIGCSNYPECKYTRPLSAEEGDDAAGGDVELGADPETGAAIWLKTGRFGPYVEREAQEEGAKPDRSSLPKTWPPDTIDLEKALRLLKLPREVGEHPEDGDMITAALGRYGPYVKHKSIYANLDSIEEVFEVGLNRAVSLIAEKKAKRGGQVLKELGEHPDGGGPVNVMEGRYGPYVKHKKTNATLPKDVEPGDVTMEQAVTLLAEKASKGGKKKAAKKKPAAKKTAAKKKPAAKKASGGSKSAAASD